MENLMSLQDASGPWVFQTSKTIDMLNPGFISPVVIADGNNMSTAEEFYEEMSRAFRLPKYFGHNLNALFDSLTDLLWITEQGIIFVIRNAHSILSKECTSALDGFVDTLSRVGNEWSNCIDSGSAWDRSSIPFNTLLVFPDSNQLDRLPNISVL